MGDSEEAVPSEPPGAEMEAADPPAKKRRTEEAHASQEPDGILTVLVSPHEMHLPSALGTNDAPPKSHRQEPLPGAATSGEQEDGGVDYISRLPDAILGEIISLLHTKDGARTRILASRWRNLWLSAPLNLDLSNAGVYEEALSDLISRIIGVHPGPGRRFSIPMRDLNCCAMTIDAWLRSPALHNLQELELEIQSHGHRCRLPQCYVRYAVSYASPCPCYAQTEMWLPLPASVFGFSATLHVVTISRCNIVDGMVERLRFPELTQLGLGQVKMSGGSLCRIIAGCPVIECLLLKNITCGFDVSIRINSPSLISFGFDDVFSRELIIEDAPSLKRLLQLRKPMMDHVLVSSAPNLEILGSIYESDYLKFKFGGTVIQKLCAVNFSTAVSSVKTLAIDNDKLNLDLVIDLMQCFSHLENLYIKISNVQGGKNLWRRKYHGRIKYIDISLKTIVLTNYRGIKSQASFATFFIRNAKMLQVMRFEGGPYKDDAEFIARRQRLLQLEKRASRGARFEFSTRICHCDLPHIKNVHDLSKADPFKCTC